MIWCIKTYIIAYVKTQKNKIYYSLCQIYSPTVLKKSISKRWTNMHKSMSTFYSFFDAPRGTWYMCHNELLCINSLKL